MLPATCNFIANNCLRLFLGLIRLSSGWAAHFICQSVSTYVFFALTHLARDPYLSERSQPIRKIPDDAPEK
jgi:hypothetical protein